MVVGSGLVARAFDAFRRNDRVLIFASGVSNSSTASEDAYQRERDLLLECAGSGKRFAYFSTVSIMDTTLANSGYICHKLAMEELVRSTFRDHTIFRLPNLIGSTSNPHTLGNYIRDRILAGGVLHVHAKACRYLMDVEDTARVCRDILERGLFSGATMNVCFDPPVTVPAMVRCMEQVLGKKGKVVEDDRGECYEVDNAPFKQHWNGSMGLPWPPADDWKRVLRKYYDTQVPTH